MLLLGCCCGTPSCGTVCVTVRGCFIAPNVAGASVALKLGGATVGSGVTGSDGILCFPITSAGNYTVAASAPGYADRSSAYSLTCKNNDISFVLQVDDAHSCTPDRCCPQAGPLPYPKIGSYPATLYANDGFSAVTLTRTTTSPYAIWTGCALRHAGTAYGATSWDINNGPIPVVTDAQVPVFFQLDCRDGWWHLFLFGAGCLYYSVSPPGLCAGRYPATGPCSSPPCYGGNIGYVEKATSCPPAFAVAGQTVSASNMNSLFEVYGAPPYVTITQ